MRDEAADRHAALSPADLVDRLHRRRAPELLPAIQRPACRVAQGEYAAAVAVDALEINERKGDVRVYERQRLQSTLHVLDDRRG